MSSALLRSRSGSATARLAWTHFGSIRFSHGLLSGNGQTWPLFPFSLRTVFSLYFARDAKTPRNLAPRADEWPENSPIPARGLACLTTHSPSSTFLINKKGLLFFLYLLVHWLERA